MTAITTKRVARIHLIMLLKSARESSQANQDDDEMMANASQRDNVGKAI